MALRQFYKCPQNVFCGQKRRGGDNYFLMSVLNSKIFTEFSPEEQKKYFGVKEKKVCHHVDTFYYSITLDGDKSDNENVYLSILINNLKRLKNQKLSKPGIDLDFQGLDVSSVSFSVYQYHLQLNECYDIFIADNIPTDDTPRVCVQLRSRFIVNEGISEAIVQSYQKVKEILSNYHLEVNIVQENRIDYAFHTNIIQSSSEYFSDEYLKEHLRTKLKDGSKWFKTKDISVEYLTFGIKASNNVFVRIYNKSREVVEKNYKSFFFEKWKAAGLISEYDYYVYQYAYKTRSYETGLLAGRINWYLQYGNDEQLKSELAELLKKCYVKSDNSAQIEKKLKGLLPNPTLIYNVEFQTKRRFYATCNNFIKAHVFKYKGIPELARLYKLLYLRKEFLEYLTTTTLCFVDNKGKKNEEMTHWWKRIHSLKIEFTEPALMQLERDYSRQTDIKRSRQRILSAIAQFNIINKQSLEERSFIEDCSDVLSYLNDNDFYGFAPGENGNVPEMKLYEYTNIQQRKARQYKGIVKENVTVNENENINENINESENEENEGNS